MKGMHRLMPTFASDYAGACSALYELGGMVIVHGAGGCAGNVVAYDEPRAYDMPARLFTSDLTDVDALLGRDGEVLSMAAQTHDLVGGDFVAIVGTPNTMIIGTDYRALARKVSEQCGVPAIWVDTTGTRTYEVGASKALLAVARDLVAPAAGDAARGSGVGREPRTVNLLGACGLDFGTGEAVREARGLLGEAGWEVASCWAMGSSVDELRAGLGAACNVVLSTSGLALARWMRDAYGTPYLWAHLAGTRARERFMADLERVAVGEAVPPTGAPAVGGTPQRGHGRALVVGDQVLACGMRAALEEDLGYAEVDVASFFTVDAEGRHAGDPAAFDEGAACAALRDGGYDLVVGDGLLAACADASSGPGWRFVSVPHPAVSSRLLDAGDPRVFGDGVLETLTAAV